MTEHREKTSRDFQRAAPRKFTPSGELTPYGERVAEDRHTGLWGMDEEDFRFGEMGPDFLPDTNVIGI